MRYVCLGFTAILLFVSIISSEPAQSEADTPTTSAATWRRTIHGWEPAGNWIDPIQPEPAYVPIHPASLAALQVLLSVGALITFAPAVGGRG